VPIRTYICYKTWKAALVKVQVGNQVRIEKTPQGRISMVLNIFFVGLKISKTNQLLVCPINWTIEIEKWGILGQKSGRLRDMVIA
jgi:hypothetical protein